MPMLEVNGTKLYYQEFGSGEETIVFSHSYLVDHEHFLPQIEVLKSDYRIIAYDHRGHGKSECPKDGYDIENLTRDGMELIKKLGITPCHWVGLSTGGFVGMRIALLEPQLIKKLVLMDTTAREEPKANQIKYNLMFATLKTLGFTPVIGETMKAMFGKTTLNDSSKKEMVKHWKKKIKENNKDALISFGKGIFSRPDITREVVNIKSPTLVLCGEEDIAVPPFRNQSLAKAIPGGQYFSVPKAGHLATLEGPEFVTEKISEFLA